MASGKFERSAYSDSMDTGDDKDGDDELHACVGVRH